MKVSKLTLVIIFSIVLIIGMVIFFNHVINKDKDKEEETAETSKIDLKDASNVPTIDAKLGDDIVITQGYLMRYVTKKRSIWYQSEGYVIDVINKNGVSNIRVGKDINSKEYITLIIDGGKSSVKKKDYVYFVGTMNLNDMSINISKVSKDEFSYSSATKMDFEELFNNMKLLKDNVFIINGYMVTEGSQYKIYDSKEDYNKNGLYFSINWKDKFNYTGNQVVYLSCKLGDSYSLRDCIYND